MSSSQSPDDMSRGSSRYGRRRYFPSRSKSRERRQKEAATSAADASALAPSQSSTSPETSVRDNNYVPPRLGNEPDFVTSPPKQRGLTTGISTLFRSKKNRKDRSRMESGDESDIFMGTDTPSQSTPTSSSIDQELPVIEANTRIFTSNDDSDDSYESRITISSRSSSAHRGDNHSSDSKPILRYRGFSTSLQSLFLDESLVCASMGCFGLILSQRTEFLLDVRNRQTSTSHTPRRTSHRHPTRLVAYTFFLTLLLICGTFVIFGFGEREDATVSSYADGDYDAYDVFEDDFYQQENNNNNNEQNGGDDDDDDDIDDGDDNSNNNDNNNGNNRRLTKSFSGVFKLRDYHLHFWEPAFELFQDEWYRPMEGRVLEEEEEESSTEDTPRDWGSDVRLILLLLFLVVLAIVGRRRRMRTRYAITRARAQEDHLYYASTNAVKVGSSEDKYEGACSHTLCGCYPVDPPMHSSTEQETEVQETQSNNRTKKKVHKHQDCIARGFSCFLASCCGLLCKGWFQCLSICALAQEAREIRLLLPPKFQRIDYITHQPFSEYQTSVNDLRRGWMGKTRRKTGLMPHIQALSRLSRYIIFGFTAAIVLITCTLLFNPRASFSWADVIVLLATFVQSFLVIYFVHWIFHKSDLSFDAVVKFFTAGFLVAVPSAFFFEGLLINVTLAFTYSLYSLVEMIGGSAFVEWVIRHFRTIWIIGELFNAYVVAAVTEEICKYYTFRAVEHPDLVFLTGLNRERQADDAFSGGVEHYTYGSHQVVSLNRTVSYESSASHRSSRSDTSIWIKKLNTEEEFAEDENDVRTLRQKAAAVTTGMISVAVGLACAENFLYVFLLSDNSDAGSSGAGAKEEWIVLFFRSIFPVHALAAALQSINMIRKFVECKADENNHRIGVGRIILPAVILHGSFDAVLLGINVYIETAWDNYLAENSGNIEEGAQPYNPVVVNLVAWLSIIFIMLFAIGWYFRENRRQSARLKQMEAEQAPSGYAKGPTEVELV